MCPNESALRYISLLLSLSISKRCSLSTFTSDSYVLVNLVGMTWLGQSDDLLKRPYLSSSAVVSSMSAFSCFSCLRECSFCISIIFRRPIDFIFSVCICCACASKSFVIVCTSWLNCVISVKRALQPVRQQLSKAFGLTP